MGEKTRMNALGLVEGYDEATGKVLWTEKKIPDQDPLAPKKRGRPRGRPTKASTETHHFVVGPNGKKIWVPKGTNPDHMPKLVWPFSEVTCGFICQMVTEGKTIREISLTEGFPPKNVIDHWARKYPEFREDLRLARIARAEYYHDEIIEIAHKTKKSTINEDRLKSEIFKWGAAVGDPDTYGNRTKISGDPNAPLQLLVDTGVRRAEDLVTEKPVEATIEDKSE
jgi:hypothetical protein